MLAQTHHIEIFDSILSCPHLRLTLYAGERVAGLIFAFDLGDAPIHPHPIGREAYIRVFIGWAYSRRARPYERVTLPSWRGEGWIHSARALYNGVGKAACFNRALEFQGVIAVRRCVIVMLQNGTGRRIPFKLQGRCNGFSARRKHALASPTSHEVVKRFG